MGLFQFPLFDVHFGPNTFEEEITVDLGSVDMEKISWTEIEARQTSPNTP